MNESKQSLDSAIKIQRHIEQAHSRHLSLKFIQTTMKYELGYKFQKIRKLDDRANSERCLISRMKFALRFIELMKTRTRIVMVDESWYVDLGQRLYQRKGQKNSQTMVQLNPRISVIIAIDSFGKLYISFSQGNNNATTMELFVRDLISQLEKENKGFRSNSLICHDCCSYF